MNSESLNCSICMHEYDLREYLPRILPRCGHTVCSKCLTKLLNDTYPRCPLDNMSLTPEKDDINIFPVNVALQKLIGRSLQWEMCKMHKEKISLICLTDKCKVCAYCVLYGGHKGHIVKSMKEIQDKRNELEASFKELGEHYMEIENTLEQRRLEFLKAIEDKFDGLICLIENKKLELSLEADAFVNYEKERLKSAFGENSILRKTLVEKITDYEEAIRQEGDYTILEEDLSGLFSRLKNNVEKRQVQNLNEKLDDIIANFHEACNGIEDLLVFLELPFDIFTENINEIYSEDVDKTATINLSVFEVYSSLRFRTYEDILEIKVRNHKPKNILLNFEEWRNLKKVKFTLERCDMREEDIRILAYICSRLEQSSCISLNSTYKEMILHTIMGPLLSAVFCRPKELKEVDINLEASKIEEQTMLFLAQKILPKANTMKTLNINLSNTNVTEKAIEMLGHGAILLLKDLESLVLNLSKTCINEMAVVRAFVNKQSLKYFELTLNSTNFTDKALEIFAKDALSSMRALQSFELWLSNTKITDKSALILFANLPNVKKFKISLQSTRVSDQSIEMFIKTKVYNLKNLKEFELHLDDSKVSTHLISQLEQIKESFGN